MSSEEASDIKILAIDIETAPALVYTWGLFDQNIGLNQIVEPVRMLCFAAKWFGQKKIHFASEHHDGRSNMVALAHKLMDDADVVVHYNGRSFDEKHLNREFLLESLTPPAPYKTVDLLSAARSNFRFMSNKLEHVSKQLGLAGKIAHEGFGLWVGCLNGDEAAWAKMRRYNKRDVTLLEDLYAELLPWIKGLPNMNQWTGSDGCPKCGAPPDVLVKRGVARTATSVFQQYYCKRCGAYSRDGSRTSAVNKRAV